MSQLQLQSVNGQWSNCLNRASLFHGTDRTRLDPDPNPRNRPEWRGTHVWSSRPPEIALTAI